MSLPNNNNPPTRETQRDEDWRHLGATVKRLRTAAGLSLTGLADESGVAKSIISRIEKNESNPTIGTLSRLARALHLGLDEIVSTMHDRPDFIDQLKAHQVPRVSSEDGLCTLKITGSIDTVEWAQTYELHAQPQGVLTSAPHPPGTVECLTLHQGTLWVTIADETREVSAGEVLRYRGDVPHEISNRGSVEARATMVNLRC